MIRTGKLLVTAAGVGLVLGWFNGCERETRKKPASSQPAPATQPAAATSWTLRQLAVIESLQVPECVAVDPAGGAAYVSNIEAAAGQYWADDGKGFISRLKPGGQMDLLRWRDSTDEARLNGPKGMCVLNGQLYIADNARLLACPLAGDAPVKVVPLQGAKRLNDLATDGKAAYVSDTAAGKIYRIEGEKVSELKAPESVNGLSCFKGRMFAVSWGLHEVYEVDPAGEAEPAPFGLAAYFKTLDGIEVLDDGTFIVSDFEGNKVCAISPDRKRVTRLAELDSPADIGLDRERKLLYVPQLMQDKVVVYQLERK